MHCSVSEAVGLIENFMKLGYVRVANRAFTSKVIIAPIGVGQGYNSRANQPLEPTRVGEPPLAAQLQR